MRISFEPTSAQQARDAAAMFSFLADRWGSRDAAEPASKSIPGTFGTAKPTPDLYAGVDFSKAKATPEDDVSPRLIGMPASLGAPFSAVGYADATEMYNGGGQDPEVVNAEALPTPTPTAEPAPKRRRTPKAPAEPLVASAETAALASNHQPDISSSLGEDLSGLLGDELPSGVTDVEVSHVTHGDADEAAPPSDDIDAELLAMMGEPKAEATTSVSRYADWDEAKLRAEFVVRLKDKGAMWFREQMLNRNRTSINALTVEDLQVILAKADADDTAA
jgi:hypothetical protein